MAEQSAVDFERDRIIGAVLPLVEALVAPAQVVLAPYAGQDWPPAQEQQDRLMVVPESRMEVGVRHPRMIAAEIADAVLAAAVIDEELSHAGVPEWVIASSAREAVRALLRVGSLTPYHAADTVARALAQFPPREGQSS